MFVGIVFLCIYGLYEFVQSRRYPHATTAQIGAAIQQGQKPLANALNGVATAVARPTQSIGDQVVVAVSTANAPLVDSINGLVAALQPTPALVPLTVTIPVTGSEPVTATLAATATVNVSATAEAVMAAQHTYETAVAQSWTPTPTPSFTPTPTNTPFQVQIVGGGVDTAAQATTISQSIEATLTALPTVPPVISEVTRVVTNVVTVHETVVVTVAATPLPATNTPAPTATQQPAPTATDTPAPTVTELLAIVGANSAEFFDSPDGDVMFSLAAGTQLTATGRTADGTWLFTRLNDATGRPGWVKTECVVIFNHNKLPITSPVGGGEN